MFESTTMPGPFAGLDDVRSDEDLDAELAALLADPRSRWTREDLDDLELSAAACPRQDDDADAVVALEGQINRLRCLLAAAHADLHAAHADRAADAATTGAEIAALRRERDAALRRRDLALDQRATAVLESRAADAATAEARAALGGALVDLALARAEQELPETYDPGTLTRRLHEAAPGPALASAVTAALGTPAAAGAPDTAGLLDQLSENALVELTAAAGRIANWAAAAQMAAAAAFTDRIASTPLAGDDHGHTLAATELALACSLSRYAMDRILTTAHILPVRLPHLHTLLRSGHLDPAKAHLVADKIIGQTPDVITAVETGVLPVITTTTRPHLAALIDQLIADADPHTHTDRVAEARTERRVTFRTAEHGMATMNLYAAAEDIETVRTVLNAATLAARHAQRDPNGPRRRPHLEDPDRPTTPTDPDGRHPAATRADTLLDLILHTTPELRATARTGGHQPRADVTVLIPFSVLFSNDNTPCDLTGYGPIPAQLARELATNATWRCAAVDDRPGSPTHATLLGLGRSAFTPNYIPPPATRTFVQARDQRCTFPGCRQPATRCDLDHRTPWNPDDPNGGATCDCNLHPLCRHHHQLKQRGYTPQRTPDGTTHWTTPLGRTYLTPPERLPGYGLPCG